MLHAESGLGSGMRGWANSSFWSTSECRPRGRRPRLQQRVFAYGCGRGCGEGRGLGVALGVAVGVAVGVMLGVAVGVAVGVDVGVAVGVGVRVGVGVGVGVPPPWLGAWISTIIGDPVLKKPTIAFAVCGG